MPFVAINPENGQRLGELPNHSHGEVQARITAAHAASRSWRQAPLAERADTLRAIAALKAAADPGWILGRGTLLAAPPAPGGAV